MLDFIFGVLFTSVLSFWMMVTLVGNVFYLWYVTKEDDTAPPVGSKHYEAMSANLDDLVDKGLSKEGAVAYTKRNMRNLVIIVLLVLLLAYSFLFGGTDLCV